MVVLRKMLDFIFTQDELRWVDDTLPSNPLAVYREKEKVEAEDDENEEMQHGKPLTPSTNIRKIKEMKKERKKAMMQEEKSLVAELNREGQISCLSAPEIIIAPPSRRTSTVNAP